MKILFHWTQHYLSQSLPMISYFLGNRISLVIALQYVQTRDGIPAADDDENACYKSCMMIYAI